MVGVSRRSVLRGAAAVAIVPFAVGAAAAAAPVAPGFLGPHTREALEAAVGTTVRIEGGGRTVTAVLERVDDLLHATAGHPDAFSARFSLQDDAAVLEQGLVDIELPNSRISGVGLLATGDPDRRRAVLLVDRRPVSEHPMTIRH